MQNVSPLEVIFFTALEKTAPRERGAYLDEACTGDPDLRRRVEKMLAAQHQAGSFLEQPASARGATVDEPLLEKPGTVIGPYTLREQIGEGGMGLVFVAEQTQPVRRKVALKVIKPGMDTRQVVARFEGERQALALMDHPNIAKVLDAGTTASGRPYFVMELVKGLTLTEYCDQHRLTTRQRLELFLPVCHAVQHAHHKGIIHRDLKPGNILVSLYDVTPVVKVIDFGIAKAIGQQLTDKTVYTGIAQLVGTPQYMSPEQAGLSNLDVDTRSDIYALGVLLYELLTGTTPFEGETLKKASYDEMRRMIREDEPPRPSTRLSTLDAAKLSTICDRRNMEPRKLSSEVRGELDWIVMKALEKDRNRRYESAGALAADVERFLRDEAVQARPHSTAYRLRKFVRRHKTGIAIGTLSCVVLASLIVSTVVYVYQKERQDQQRIAIEQAVAKDLDMADLWQAQERWASALQAIEQAKARITERGQSALQAEVEGRRRNAALVVQLEKIAMLGASQLGPNLRDVKGMDEAYGAAFADYGLNLKALPQAEAVRLIRASSVCNYLVKALDNWSFYLNHWGQKSEAGERLRAIAQQADDDAWRKQLREPQIIGDRKTLISLAESESVLAQPPESVMILFHLLEEATKTAGKAPPSRREVLGSQDPGVQMLLRVQKRHPASFWVNLNLGYHLANDPELAGEAIGYCRVALAVQPQNPLIHYVLGGTFWEQKKLPQAAEAFRRAIDLETSPEGCVRLGVGLFKIGMLEEAEGAVRKAIHLDTDKAESYVPFGIILPEAERRKWQKLCEDVAQLERLAAGSTK
jgi:serine/threonine protein kinase